MWCRSSSSSRPASLQLHAVVERPWADECAGRISVRPVGRHPVVLQWSGPGGRPVQVDESGTEAYGVVAGKYHVTAEDEDGAHGAITLDVAPANPDALVVREYRVTHASSRYARDGSVEAVGTHLERARAFLWTHGVETREPCLHDVPCGRYAVHALDSAFVHLCQPAHVRVRCERGRGVTFA